MDHSLISRIETVVRKAQANNTPHTEIFQSAYTKGENEFLFFIKPELTLADPQIQFASILEMILGKIDAFGLKIKRISLLPSTYLEKHGLIARHYGVINALARTAKDNFSTEAKEQFKLLYGIPAVEATILGGLEFIQNHPQFTATTTDYIWQNAPVQKLGGGAYCGLIKLDGEAIYLVNGFHPRQLEHFIASGRSIVAFTLVGDTKWNIARNSFIGKTNPNDALPGSIRRTLLENKQRYGLKTISSSWNGVHLSAGPIEGLVELIRYNSDFDHSTILTAQNFDFGKKLIALLGEDRVSKILQNPIEEFEGKLHSIFDLTEEKNSEETLVLLSRLYKK